MKLIRKKKNDEAMWADCVWAWDNLNNPVNLTGIWKKIDLTYLDCWDKARYVEATSHLNFEIPMYNDEKYLISLYLISVTTETGFIFRPMLCKFRGWDDDEVEFYDTHSNESILRIFMKGIGLEYKRYPNSNECVQMIEKLIELDEKFKKQFDERFIIEEIPDSREGLLIEYFNRKDECRRWEQKIAEKDKENRKLFERIQQDVVLLQRILIDEHRKECEKLVEEWEVVIENYNKCHSTLEQIRTQLAKNPDDSNLKMELEKVKDLWTDAKWQKNLVRKKGLERIFGKNQEYINFEFLKDYLSNNSL